MFYEDVGPYQYELLMTITTAATGTPTALYNSAGSDVITWGEAYDDTDVTGHGIVQSFTNDYDAFGAAQYEATLRIPHLSLTVTRTGAGHLTSLRLALDDVELAGTCTEKELSWDELRWYVGGVLEHTEAASANTATDYDPRLNRVLRTPLAAEGLVSVLGTPSCLDALHDSRMLTTLTKGWRVDKGAGWVNPSIRLITISVPSPIGGGGAETCPCEESLSGVSGTDCYNVTIVAEERHRLTDTYVETVTCPCPVGAGTQEADKDLRELEYRSKTTWVVLAPTDKSVPILKHTEVGRSLCADLDTGVLTGPYNESSQTVVDTATTVAAPYNVTLEVMHGETHCYTSTIPDPCLFPPGGDECYEEYLLACQYDADFTVDWPEKPPCGSEAPFGDVHGDSGHIRAYVADGTIWIGKRNNPAGSAWTDTDTGITGSDPSVRYDRASKAKTARLLYIDGSGDLIERVETNNSGTFS